MNNTEKLNKYIPMVEFIAEIVGNNCEVVLHDVTNPDRSIIAIANGYISGRKVSGPITALALKILKDKSYKDKNFICNYKGSSKNNKVFRSSSYFIKDDQGELIGMICMNVDVTDMTKARDLLDGLIQIKDEDKQELNDENNPLSFLENLEENIEDVINSVISGVLLGYSIEPERMSADEKMEVVKKLNEKGIFLLKGGVSEVAKNLKTSETTIYRYLSKIK